MQPEVRPSQAVPIVLQGAGGLGHPASAARAVLTRKTQRATCITQHKCLNKAGSGQIPWLLGHPAGFLGLEDLATSLSASEHR